MCDVWFRHLRSEAKNSCASIMSERLSRAIDVARQILVAMEYYSKWVETYALRNQEATSVREMANRFVVPLEFSATKVATASHSCFRKCAEFWPPGRQ